VFHSPQAGHRPIHFEYSFPQWEQNQTLFVFVAIITNLSCKDKKNPGDYSSGRLLGEPIAYSAAGASAAAASQGCSQAPAQAPSQASLQAQAAESATASMTSSAAGSAFLAFLLPQAAAANIIATSATEINTFFMVFD
jgi:hypothetical protein